MVSETHRDRKTSFYFKTLSTAKIVYSVSGKWLKFVEHLWNDTDMGKSNCSVRHKFHQDFESHMGIRGERKQKNRLGLTTMWKHTQTFSITLDCRSTATTQGKIIIRRAYFFVRRDTWRRYEMNATVEARNDMRWMRLWKQETIWDECDCGSKKRYEMNATVEARNDMRWMRRWKQ